MASAFSFTLNKTIPLGPKHRLITGTVVLANTHDTGGDTCDLSSYFPTAVLGGWPIDDFSGYKLDYYRDTAGAPTTGKVHAWRGNNDGTGDGVMITAATVNLASITGEFAFVGY